MIVTQECLVELGISDECVERFAQVFGKRAKVTRRSLRRAAKAGLDAERWFTRAFPSLRDEYFQQTEALWDVYRRRVDSLRDEHYRQWNTLWGERHQLADALGREYRQRKGALRYAYHRRRIPVILKLIKAGLRQEAKTPA